MIIVIIKFIMENVYKTIYNWPLHFFNFIICSIITAQASQAHQQPSDIKVESAEDVLESLDNKDKGEILKSSEVILCPGSFLNVSSSKIRKSDVSFCEDVIQDGFDLASTISPSESRHDSIVELYCDDEFRMGLELDNSHLGLSSSEDLTSMIGSVEDIIDDDRDEIFLPYSVPSVMLRESFKDTFEWENVESTDSMACIS